MTIRREFVLGEELWIRQRRYFGQDSPWFVASGLVGWRPHGEGKRRLLSLTQLGKSPDVVPLVNILIHSPDSLHAASTWLSISSATGR